LVERTQEVEKEPKELATQKEEDRPEVRGTDISPERIERMKRAFRPTWLHEQINSNGKSTGKKD
jgi:hypothetical protein